MLKIYKICLVQTITIYFILTLSVPLFITFLAQIGCIIIYCRVYIVNIAIHFT